MSLRDDCKDFMEAQLGHAVTNPDDIERRIRAQMKLLAIQSPDEWRKLGYYDRLQQAAAAAAKDMAEELKRKQFIVQKQIEAHDRIENVLGASEGQEPTGASKLFRFLRNDRLAAVSRLLDFDTRGGETTSVQSWANAIRNEAYGRLMPLWDAIPGRFFGLFENAKGIGDLWKELHGEDSGNAIAKAGAAAWRQVTEELRQRFNDAGGSTGKLEDWAIPQHHSQERVAKAGVDKWISDILPRLDRNRYLNTDGSRMTDEQMHEFLGHAYDSIITDGQNSREPGQVAGIGMVANRHSASRALHFKNADAHAEYQSLYGENSLVSVLANHVSRLSRDIALVERLGPNPERTFRYFNDRAKLDETRENPDRTSQIDTDHKFNEALYDAVAGREKVINQKLANISQGFRNWMTATRLGKVAITALGDEAGMASTAFANRIPYGSALLRELKTLKPGDHADRRAAESAGLGLDATLQGLNRWGQEEFGSKWHGKLASQVMQVSGAERMWAARRQGMGAVLMSSIGNLTRDVEHVEQLSEGDHGVLAKKGVTDKVWQVWRRANPEDWGAGAHSVLTPKSVWDIPDEKLADLAGAKATGAPAGGMVRYYHGGEATGTGPLWMTSSLEDARGWARNEGSSKLWYVDVPENHPARGGDLTNGIYPPTRMELPAELATRRQLLTAPAAAAIRALKREASTQLLAHVLEEAGMGAMDTGPRQRVAVNLGTTRGSYGGELWRASNLFRGFAFSMMMKHWARASSMGGIGAAKYLAPLFVYGTAIAAAGNQIRNVLAGQNPDNMTDPSFWGRAVLRGGGLGFFGDFLQNEVTQHDTSLTAAVGGPGLTTLEELLQLTHGAFFKERQGMRTDEGAKLIRFGRENIPFTNLWYTQAAFDHLVWNNMQEAASPGYLERLEARQEALYGKSYFWQPNQGLPSQLPDLSQAVAKR